MGVSIEMSDPNDVFKRQDLTLEQIKEAARQVTPGKQLAFINEYTRYLLVEGIKFAQAVLIAKQNLKGIFSAENTDTSNIKLPNPLKFP